MAGAARGLIHTRAVLARWSRIHMIQKPTAMFGHRLPAVRLQPLRDVVVAVSKAGGLGVFGALHYTPDQLREELRWIEAHVTVDPTGSIW